jgi:hypothetical protein
MGPYSSGAKTFTAGEALARGRRVKLSSGTVIYADADEMAIGVTMADVASGEVVGVRLLGGQTHKVTASAAVTACANIYATADGKVDDAGAGSGSTVIGVAIEAALADGDIIECILNADVA